MKSQDTTAPTSLDELYRLLAKCLHRVTHAIQGPEHQLDELHHACSLLEAMPLTTGEFALATSRLDNARRYFQSGESGAAHYELNLLLHNFAQPERTQKTFPRTLRRQE